MKSKTIPNPFKILDDNTNKLFNHDEQLINKLVQGENNAGWNIHINPQLVNQQVGRGMYHFENSNIQLPNIHNNAELLNEVVPEVAVDGE